MPIASLDKVSLAFGLRPLLTNASLDIRRGERICLLGRNGEGKSSMIKLLTREITPDSGIVWIRPGARVAHLAQQVAADSETSVRELISSALDRERADDPHAEWQLEQRVDSIVARLGLDASAPMSSLSGGWRRRALLGVALVSAPELLLLDEPTNHLDIDAIDWLEEQMLAFRGALLFVSHDRAFVRRLASRIVELDRGRLRSWVGTYDDYVVKKSEALVIEAQHDALFDKRLALEEVWIRKGVEARRTRNEGRVRALESLRIQRRERLERSGPAKMQLQEVKESGALVFEAENVSYEIESRPIVTDFSARIMRGDRIGLIGPNGAGKTTLLKLLLGELTPQRGTVKQGTRLQIAYFDQQRAQLNETQTVMQNVTGGRGDSVLINGQPRHVSGYLQDFLFSPERLNAPISLLSGGERNRLLLACLFAQPANLLVLDEPTNDLDVETLELLEELVANFDGTLLLVSHDRAFLDNVVTSTLVFESGGRVREFVGGYTDSMRQRAAMSAPKPREPPASKASTPVPKKPKKLSFKIQRELDTLPEKIADLEAEQARLNEAVSDPGFYSQPREKCAEDIARLQAIDGELQSCFARWENLEATAAPPQL
jgi:ABC transport system ATP-binding/permease protein